MQKSIVLSDELLREYYAFKHNEKADVTILESLLSAYKPHITNQAQLTRIGITKGSYYNSLLSSGLTKQTLLGLADKTKYKIILDDTKTEYPFINIFKDEIENNFTGTYYKGQERIKAQEHIKALLKNARHVFIYDKHITDRWNFSRNFFTELLPRKNLKIYYKEEYCRDIKRIKSHLEPQHSDIKNIYDWDLGKDNSNNEHISLHDRYLIIDGKIEIILTSGFDNLFDISSDFTYIVRDVKNA